MMISYLATATVAVGLLAATPQPPKWEASYGKALKATQASEHPLLVVLDESGSSDGRISARLLSENSIDGKEAELLRPYELCHIDVTTKYGKKVAGAFRAKRFPHVAIIDKTGSAVLYQKSGQFEPKEWQTILARYKDGERKTVSRVSYRPIPAYYPSAGSSCPNCQRSSF